MPTSSRTSTSASSTQTTSSPLNLVTALAKAQERKVPELKALVTPLSQCKVEFYTKTAFISLLPLLNYIPLKVTLFRSFTVVKIISLCTVQKYPHLLFQFQNFNDSNLSYKLNDHTNLLKKQVQNAWMVECRNLHAHQYYTKTTVHNRKIHWNRGSNFVPQYKSLTILKTAKKLIKQKIRKLFSFFWKMANLKWSTLTQDNILSHHKYVRVLAMLRFPDPRVSYEIRFLL